MSATLHGKAAPDFRLPAVVSGKVKELSLSEFEGKYVVLLFSPRTCYRDEPFAPSVITWSQHIGDFQARDSQLLAVSTDWGSSWAWLSTQSHEAGLGEVKIPLVIDKEHSLARAYSLTALDEEGNTTFPKALFIIDPGRLVRHISIAYQTSIKDTLCILDALKEKETASG